VVSGGALAEPEPEGEPDRLTILVVEDEVLLRMAVAGVLRERGSMVAEAANAEEALAILQSGVKVDVVFSDVNMPGSIDGVCLAGIIRAEYPEIKVVVTSGHLQNLPTVGQVTGFVPKPYNLLTLASQIESLCDVKDANPSGQP
jgi:CheY-like chemotaxis protein